MLTGLILSYCSLGAATTKKHKDTYTYSSFLSVLSVVLDDLFLRLGLLFYSRAVALAARSAALARISTGVALTEFRTLLSYFPVCGVVDRPTSILPPLS